MDSSTQKEVILHVKRRRESQSRKLVKLSQNLFTSPRVWQEFRRQVSSIQVYFRYEGMVNEEMVDQVWVGNASNESLAKRLGRDFPNGVNMK